MDNNNIDKTITINPEDLRTQYPQARPSSPVTDLQDIIPGATLGKWRVLQKLADGGMGEIFICHPQDNIKTRAVMKILRTGASISSNTKNRFFREYQLQKELDHPCIAKILDGCFEGELEYIVIEFIEGITLAQAVREEYCFPTDYCTYMLESLGEAFQYAWENFHILHRDIKPSNIMFKDSGELVILDFGIAKSLDNIEGELTLYNQVLGSPGFMSPEQIKHFFACDCRSDIFSLGATIYYLMTRQKPFPGDNIAAIYDNMLHNTAIPLAEFDPAIPREFSDIIAQMLAINPADRPQSWDDLLKKTAAVKAKLFPEETAW